MPPPCQRHHRGKALKGAQEALGALDLSGGGDNAPMLDCAKGSFLRVTDHFHGGLDVTGASADRNRSRVVPEGNFVGFHVSAW